MILTSILGIKGLTNGKKRGYARAISEILYDKYKKTIDILRI